MTSRVSKLIFMIAAGFIRFSGRNVGLRFFGVIFVLACVFGLSPLTAEDSRVSIPLEKTRLAYQMQKWQDVVPAAGELLAAAPEHLEGHFMLAIAETRLGQHEAAIKRLTWLNFKVADSAVYRHSLAEALLAAGLVEQAITQAQYAVQLAPAEPMYNSFLQRISAKGEVKTVPATPTDIAGVFVSSAPVVKTPMPIKEKTVSEFEEYIKSVADSCDKNADQEMQLIFAAVTAKPELMADPNWSLLQKRLNRPDKDLYKEAIRQFLLWNSGEQSLKEYEKFIGQSRVKNLAWQSDENLQKIAENLARYGVTPGRKPESAVLSMGSLSWFESLDENVRVAFFDARYDDAWTLHTAAHESETGGLAAYQSARLALELWQLNNFKHEWLEIAQKHLKECVNNGVWRENAEILLTEVTGMLEGKVK
ncbi:MAG: hypothetical protein KKB51_16355 [Candidatus Riflebacteria bacterium]|nr:hypothetical protein [Candidatus Riflebacteria bacterium]